MTLLEKIVKVAYLEEVAENCTTQDCNSIMETLLSKKLAESHCQSIVCG